MIGIVMFFSAMVMLLLGIPVAFTFASVSFLFAIIAGYLDADTTGFFSSLDDGLSSAFDMFDFMPFRIMSIMKNTILMAIPMFIFMGFILQKTGIAEKLLESMGKLFGEIRGGVAISTVLVGSLLAASTGIVGASVVSMGVICLPIMLKHKYKAELSCGTICASGTLGQIIPPSIVLIVLGDVFQLPVGDLFKAAVWPGALLVILYIVYILVYSFIKKDAAPPIAALDLGVTDKKAQIVEALMNIVPPLLLIIFVLGSIFYGIATPTESASVGCVCAIILGAIKKKFSLTILKEAALESVKISSMIFAILIGATAFAMVFNYTGGDEVVEQFMASLPGDAKWSFVIFTMLAIFILGFFIDFIEIAYIVLPILLPVADALGINLMWFAILIAMNLQTSFLTPPFGFSLFYLKGVAPPGLKTTQIYRGVMPFIVIQVLVLALIALYPGFFGLQNT